MQLPKKITPCPIAEAIVEIRFDSNPDIPADAIWGIIYNSFKEEYSFKSIEKLPILQIPEPVRLNDPALIYKPNYKLSNEKFIFQIGPKVISLASAPNYIGWRIFSEKIKETFSKIQKLDIIYRVSRLGIRYINFFKSDIFENMNLQVNMNNEPLKSRQTIVRIELPSSKFVNTLQIANNSQIDISGILENGSVIDIDTFLSENNENFFDEMDDLLEEGHQEEKKLFFNLLKREFWNTLNPEY